MIRATTNKIVVERDAVSETTAGGIVVPAGYAHGMDVQESTVLSVGPEAGDELSAGMRVLVPARIGTKVERDKRTLWVVSIDDVIGVLEG